MTAILGLNAYHGDAAAALVIDGELVAAAEEERFNRIRHSAGFPERAAAWCLVEAGLSVADLDHVVVGRDPRANRGQKVRQTLQHRPSPRFVRARLENSARIRDLRGTFAARLAPAGDLRASFHHVEHHVAHAASAFFVSPFDEAAVLSLDGFGDFASTMLAHGRGNRLEILDRVLFPHSLGIFYTAVTQWLGFPDYGDEGKVMGLAPYGTPRRLDDMRSLVRLNGSLFELGLEYFTHHTHGVDMTWDERTPAIGRIYSDRLVETFGPAREPGAPIEPRHETMAASLQAMLEESYLHVARELHRRTGSRNVCLAGGVALNAPANSRVRLETPFENVYVQPAAGDSGTAVGAAFFAWHQLLDRPRGFVMEHAYTGPSYRDDEIASAAAAAGIPAERLEDETLFPLAAERLADGDIVGWFQGRMEFGPRALGNRSILADPRRQDLKDVLNARIKHRESFRPFAPSVLSEAADEWFERASPSPFMTLVYRTRDEQRERIPAVNHVDDSGRVQTVEQRTNPRFHRLVEEFGRRTGVPLVLNTSFNENEPIVMTPGDALACFERTQIDLLVLGNHVVRRTG